MFVHLEGALFIVRESPLDQLANLAMDVLRHPESTAGAGGLHRVANF